MADETASGIQRERFFRLRSFAPRSMRADGAEPVAIDAQARKISLFVFRISIQQRDRKSAESLFILKGTTMKRRIIATPKAPAAIGPYSQAVMIDDVLYCSGQLGLSPETGEFVSDNVGEQTTQVLTNVGAVLEAAGLSFQDVIKTTIFLADINDYKVVNEIYATFFSAPYPARSAVQAAHLPKYGKVEIEVVACKVTSDE